MGQIKPLPDDVYTHANGRVYAPPSGQLPPRLGEITPRSWGNHHPVLGKLAPRLGEIATGPWGNYPPGLGEISPGSWCNYHTANGKLTPASQPNTLQVVLEAIGMYRDMPDHHPGLGSPHS